MQNTLNASLDLPPELQPKPRAQSATNIASAVAAVSTLIGIAVSAYSPNLQGTWEHWAAIAAPLAVSVISSLVAIKKRDEVLRPTSSATAAQLASIIDRERNRASHETIDELVRRKEQEVEATQGNEPFVFDTIGQPPLLQPSEPQRITELPLVQLVEQLPELAENFAKLAPALATLSSVVSMVQSNNQAPGTPPPSLPAPPQPHQ